MQYVRKLTEVEAKWCFIRIHGKYRKTFPESKFVIIFNGKRYMQTIDRQNRMWVGKIQQLGLEAEATFEITKNTDESYTLKKL